MKPSISNNSTSPLDSRIDSALNVYARSVPDPGMEARIAAHLAGSLRFAAPTSHPFRALLFRRFSVGALAAAAACGIVIGSLEHARTLSPPIATMPQTSGSTGGIGAASSGHLPSRAVPAAPSIDPNHLRTPPRSRARLSRNAARHPNGSAVPSSPYPAGANQTDRPPQ